MLTHLLLLGCIAYARADVTISEAKLVFEPEIPVLGGPVTVKCLVVASTLSGIKYEWHIDEKRLTTRSGVLRYADIGENNFKMFKCTASSAGVARTSSDRLDALQNDDKLCVPTISSNLDTEAYGEGEKYFFYCNSRSRSKAMSYKWYVNSKVQQTTSYRFTYKVTPFPVDITCMTVVNDVRSQRSEEVVVQGKMIKDVEILGPTRPLASFNANYTCSITKAVGAKHYEPRYQWVDKHANNIEKAKAQTYVLKAETANDGKYTCDVTMSSETRKASTELTAAYTRPATPVILKEEGVAHKINKGGNYDLKCKSASANHLSKYKWIFIKQGGREEVLGSTGHIHTIKNAGTDNEGVYRCSITVSSLESQLSENYMVNYIPRKGLDCESVHQCTVGGDRTYTGNCIAYKCECHPNMLLQDACKSLDEGGDGGAATSVSASLAVMLVGLLATFLL